MWQRSGARAPAAARLKRASWSGAGGNPPYRRPTPPRPCRGRSALPPRDSWRPSARRRAQPTARRDILGSGRASLGKHPPDGSRGDPPGGGEFHTGETEESVGATALTVIDERLARRQVRAARRAHRQQPGAHPSHITRRETQSRDRAIDPAEESRDLSFADHRLAAHLGTPDMFGPHPDSERGRTQEIDRRSGFGSGDRERVIAEWLTVEQEVECQRWYEQLGLVAIVRNGEGTRRSSGAVADPIDLEAVAPLVDAIDGFQTAHPAVFDQRAPRFEVVERSHPRGAGAVQQLDEYPFGAAHVVVVPLCPALQARGTHPREPAAHRGRLVDRAAG